MGALHSISDDRGDESFADDLNMGRGIVSGRVALLLRSTEIRPHRPNDLLPLHAQKSRVNHSYHAVQHLEKFRKTQLASARCEVVARGEVPTSRRDKALRSGVVTRCEVGGDALRSGGNSPLLLRKRFGL